MFSCCLIYFRIRRLFNLVTFYRFNFRGLFNLAILFNLHRLFNFPRLFNLVTDSKRCVRYCMFIDLCIVISIHLCISISLHLYIFNYGYMYGIAIRCKHPDINFTWFVCLVNVYFVLINRIIHSFAFLVPYINCNVFKLLVIPYINFCF